MIAKCTCKANSLGSSIGAIYQDQTYGRDNRIMNPTAKGSYRCTVCSRESSPSKVEKDSTKR